MRVTRSSLHVTAHDRAQDRPGKICHPRNRGRLPIDRDEEPVRRMTSRIAVATRSGPTGAMPAEIRRVSASLVWFSRSNPGVRVSGG